METIRGLECLEKVKINFGGVNSDEGSMMFLVIDIKECLKNINEVIIEYKCVSD